MHTWVKIKIAILILVSMVLTSCQDPPPPPQVVKAKPVVVTVKIEQPLTPVNSIEKPSIPKIPKVETGQVTVLPIKPEIQSKLKSEPESETKPEFKIKPEPESKTKPETKQEITPPPEEEATNAEELLSGAAKLEPYSSTGKIDPFLPLIRTEPEKQPVQEDVGEKKPTRILTPLEKFDLSQIRLVAIVLAQSGKVAMVEEASGKGYEIRVGTYLGKDGGKVEEILEDRIVIKEIVKDFRGNAVTRTKEMKLHKQEIEG